MPTPLTELVSASVPHYLPLACRFLLDEMHVPASMVVPPHELKCYIDAQPTHRFLVAAGSVMPMRLDNAPYDLSSFGESACYRPGADRLYLVSEMIDSEATEAGLAPAVLAEILLAHECLHAAMMGNVIADRPGPVRDWVARDDLRYIHEAVALRFCASLPVLSGGRISAAQVDSYLRLVQGRYVTSKAGPAYAPYFTDFRDTPTAELWQALTGDVPLVAELSRTALPGAAPP